ncbi:hypothetical protein ACQKDB_15690 [Planococcus kocurii]|uniref:Uncharacterized protein n=1 Tax=Planococcus versutus TaxID=1302659 RepID=A0A1B1S5Y3_9BACL|nr:MULTISPECIES: hypothetical protein [Planococcus]ANU28606.1 hypothetical protein I858_016635 [Planococcus versutus]
MKKKLGLGIFSTIFAVSLLLVSTMPAFAAQGPWSSAFKYDINGISSVGTSNASEGGNYQLRVVYATGTIVGNKSYYLGTNKSASSTFYGTPSRDKKGMVLVSPQYYHSPWFEV